MQLVRKIGMTAHRVTSEQSLAESLLKFLGIGVGVDMVNSESEVMAVDGSFDSPRSQSGRSEGGFTIDAVKYLKAKNVVDDASFNPSVWAELLQALEERVRDKTKRPRQSRPATNESGATDHASEKEEMVTVRVIDLGAGLLNMLHRVVPAVEKIAAAVGVQVELQYLAFEQSEVLQDGILSVLAESGYVPSSGRAKHPLQEFTRTKQGVHVHVAISQRDFMSSAALGDAHAAFAGIGPHSQSSRTVFGEEKDGAVTPPSPDLDLIVGCCVADLVEPSALSAQVRTV